jgi:endonuclease YncB( thermonuclease family)
VNGANMAASRLDSALVHRQQMLMRLFCLTLLMLAVSGPVAAAKITGRVVAVLDGDTVDVLQPDRTTVRLRLAEIDAPEKGQPYGDASKRLLASLVFGRDILFQASTRDRNGRWIARIMAGATDVNAEMVRRGGAWRYVQYSHDGMFVSYEAEARMAKAGLWALPAAQRMPPWDWRHGGKPAASMPRARRSAAPVIVSGGAASAPQPAIACSPRRYCREMSCAEAYAWLRACGPEGVDGDRDGRPCEAQCRR